MTRVLVIRLSAIGDVAMTIPVIYSAALSNPEVSFTVLTQTFLLPLFINKLANVELCGMDIKGKEKNLTGLVRFAASFSSGHSFDFILDLHNVLRTRLICTFFRLRGKKIFVLDKARKARKLLTRKKNKVLKPLIPVIDRYADVFKKSGLKYKESFISLFFNDPVKLSFPELYGLEKDIKKVGIAPFAKHQGKIYPVEKMKQVVEALSARKDLQIFLLGGGILERNLLEQWAAEYPNVRSLAGCYSLDDELKLISKLDVLISMDSANMHFASLVGTRVISIWGATHPYAGFYGYKQRPEDVVQLDLSCRPCSAFGQKKCWRGDWACMALLSPGEIINAVGLKLK